MKPNEDRSLIPQPTHELTPPLTLRSRLLNEMVETSLTLVREDAPAGVDLDFLVREGKILYSNGLRGATLHASELEAKKIQAFDLRLESGLLRQEGSREEDIQIFKLFYRAAETGHSEAQFIVSRCYQWGYGAQQEHAQKLKWLRKSSESGYAEAQNQLALLYELGQGVPEDNKEALNWYRIAAEQGNTGGQWQVGRFYRDGNGVPQEYVEAARWFRKGAEQGCADAQWQLSHCYDVGYGVPQDKAEAEKWFRKAADQGGMRPRGYGQ